MKNLVFVPVLGAVLFAAACSEGDDPVAPVAPASVRFFNATTGMPGSGGFTMNGEFASALPFGEAAATCASAEPGATSFGFGPANVGGTGLSGTPLATLSGQSLTAGGKFIVVTSGAAANPTLSLLDDAFSAPMGAAQAAVRFVNLAPATGETVNTFTVLKGTLGAGTPTVVGVQFPVGAATEFTVMNGGSNTFTVMRGHEPVMSAGEATLVLPGGTVNTIAIVPNATSAGYRLVSIPRC